MLKSLLSEAAALRAVLGERRYQAKDYAGAIAHFTAAIRWRRNDPYAGIYIDRACAYFCNKAYDEAISDYSRAIELDPNSAAAYDSRGMGYQEKGKWDQAIADHTKAIELDPNDPESLKNRAEAYRQLGDHQRADADEARATELEAAQKEELYRATSSILDEPEKAPKPLGSMGLLLGSIALFAVFNWLQGRRDMTIVHLIVVALLHEAGHFVGMRVFGYRNVKMFFIPLFGAAVSGRRYGAPAWQEAVVLLLGPLPGLFLALFLAAGGFVPSPDHWLSTFTTMLIVINAFNLLPIKPLDGGRLLDVLFFARQPLLAVGFQVLTFVCLAGLVWIIDDIIARLINGGIAAFMLLTLRSTYNSAVWARRVRETPMNLPDTIEGMAEPERRTLFARVLAVSPFGSTPEAIAEKVRRLYESLVARRASTGVQALLMGLYLSGFAAAFACFIYLPGDPPQIVEARQIEDGAFRKRLKGQHDAALRDYQAALALREKVLAEHPGNKHHERGVAHALTDIGNLLNQMGRKTEALAFHERSFAIIEKLIEAFPNDYLVAGDHFRRLQNVGQSLLALGRHDEALALFGKALDSAEKLLRINSKYGWGDKARAHKAYADALLTFGKRADAHPQFTAAVRSYLEFEKSVGDYMFALSRSDLDACAINLGELSIELGRSHEAIAAFKTGLANAEAELAATAKRDSSSELVAYHLQRVSFEALRAREFARALSAADRALALNTADLRSHAMRAHALLALQRTEQAVEIYQANKGKPMSAGSKTAWEAQIAFDLAALRRAGLDRSMLAAAEAAIGGPR
jgi:tetratricopeptide (TPR) repeat protein